jgi:uncharacterized protein (TIGR02246 family)
MTAPSTIYETSTDREEILALNERLRAAWNAHDAAAFAEPWEDDADHVNNFGMAIVGRTSIEKAAAFIHSTMMAQSHSEVVVRSLRFLAPGVALLDLEQTLTGVGAGPGGPSPWTRDGRMQTMIKLVLRKTDGAWRVASFQNTAVLSPKS